MAMRTTSNNNSMPSTLGLVLAALACEFTTTNQALVQLPGPQGVSQHLITAFETQLGLLPNLQLAQLHFSTLQTTYIGRFKVFSPNNAKAVLAVYNAAIPNS
jgi:hypothetical protein